MLNKMYSIVEKYIPHLCVIVLVAYYAPYFILGESSKVAIHDNLDSTVVWAKLILENDQLFTYKNNQVPQLMNGVTKLYYNNDISFLFFKFFGMYWGYVANKIVMAIVAFFGMYLLLKKYFIPGEQNKIIHYSLGLIFAILPFWSFTLTSAGLPIALYAILNIRNGQKQWYNWVILVLFGFYSILVLSVFFFLVILSFIWLIDYIKTKKANKYFFISILVLTISSIASHFPLFYSFLTPSDTVSHRFEFYNESISFKEAIHSSITLFKNGQYHSYSCQMYMFPAIFLSIFFIRGHWKTYKKMFLILLFLIVTSLFYGFINWEHSKFIFDKIMDILPIHLQRIHFLHPMLWFIVFAIALSVFVSNFKFGKIIAILFIFIELCFVFNHHEFRANRSNPSYESFFSEDLFVQVKKSIKKETSDYKVISIGIHPAVTQYNGFYTLDGYNVDYPLSYKHQFRKVIAPELKKSEVLRKHFDNWGCRCYAFSAELGTNSVIGKNFKGKIKQLDYNFKELRKMGAEYIISAVEINTKNKNDLTLKSIFSNDKSYYKIFLYELSTEIK